MHSKLPDEIKVRLCETIKRMVINAASLLHGTDRSKKVEVIVETSNITSNHITSNHLERKTRSSVVERLEEEVLLFSKEISDDSALVFKKATIYTYLNAFALRVLRVPATSAPVECVFSTSGSNISQVQLRPHTLNTHWHSSVFFISIFVFCCLPKIEVH